ncbi:MAG TPA: riboflavin synthase subunit alpha [Fusobacterium sp.]|nr:riboflavin synthase subunit alpha [Fusobacterium nucleatum]HCE32489.1 riboflavin synthase subunit alpha [Fusobacterium sp.]
MSQANLDLFEADLSASLSNLQRILNFYPLRNLASNELFLIYLCKNVTALILISP